MKVSYPAALRVSIWLGHFASEEDLEDAITRDVEPRLKLTIDLSRIAESTFSESPSSVRDLLEGFSGWRTFIEQAVTAAEKKSLPALNSAFVCFHLDCSDAPEAWGKFSFIGCFDGNDRTSP